MSGLHAGFRWHTVLFDLDGTLIDTSAGIREALADALDEMSAGPEGSEDADLSLPLGAMIRSVRPAASPAEESLLIDAFRRHYDSGAWMMAELCAGALECIRLLDTSGVRCYVVTNKRQGAAVRILNHFDLSPHLKGVVGQADFGDPVPKAKLAGQLLQSEGIDPATAVVVGDSDHDEVMAVAWGLPFIALIGGAGPLSPTPIAPERVEVDSLADVASLVLGEDHGRKP